MIKIVARVIQLQFLALCIYILCGWIAGPENAVLWFVASSLTLLALAICVIIHHHRQR
jgi:hypothetical protein